MRVFLRRGMLLLGSLPALLAAGQSPLPTGPVTPDNLSRFCAPQGAACTVPLAGAYTLTLAGDWHLPRSMHVRFAPGATLNITSGVLHFDGGTVDASAGEPIFPDGDRVRGLAAARPEWFASPAHNPTEPLPATALAQAYEATEPWGTIYLQALPYLSPFSGCSSTPLRWISPRTLVGEGRPTPDDPTAPTRLQGGTVLLGGVFGTAPLRLVRLGIDAGPAASAGVLHGCQPPGIFIEQPNHQFVSGDRLEDISVLTTGAPSMHSVMIAGHDGVDIRDLWIWTLGGTHGLVMKSSHSVVDGFHCVGASSDCLIVKSDYATDFLGRAVHDRVSHVDIRPLRPGGYVGGIIVESRWDTVRALEMEDIHETRVDYGLTVVGSAFYHPRDITVHHWTSDGVSVLCLAIDRADSLSLSDFHCGLQPAAQAAALMNDSKGLVLNDVTFTCTGSPAECAAGHTDGIVDTASEVTFRNVTVDGLGGYALKRSRPSQSTDGLRAANMGGRLVTNLEDSGWMRRMWPDAKPDLRILYTAAYVRVLYRPRLYSSLAALLVLLIAWEVLHRRSRRRTAPDIRRT